jgi:hypothetical protein
MGNNHYHYKTLSIFLYLVVLIKKFIYKLTLKTAKTTDMQLLPLPIHFFCTLSTTQKKCKKTSQTLIAKKDFADTRLTLV